MSWYYNPYRVDTNGPGYYDGPGCYNGVYYGNESLNYPSYGSSLSFLRIGQPVPTSEIIEERITQAFVRAGIPAEVVSVNIDRNPHVMEMMLTISIDRGDQIFSSIIRMTRGGTFVEIQDEVEEVMRDLTARAVSEPHKKLKDIKYNLKDYLSWLKEEAPDEDFINVFMEYFGEDLYEEE